MDGDDVLARDFRPERPVTGLVLFALLYVLPGLVATRFLVAELLPPAESGREPQVFQFVAILAMWILGAAVVLLYMVFGAQRFRFAKDGFAVFTWRGWQRFAWQQVERAGLSTYKGTVELTLFVGRRRVVSVPLSSFGDARGLLDAIRGWTGLAIVASPAQDVLIGGQEPASGRDSRARGGVA